MKNHILYVAFLIAVLFLNSCHKIAYLPHVTNEVTVSGNMVTFKFELDRDDESCLPQVEYDTDANFKTARVVVADALSEIGHYEVVLEGLQPNTKYYYRFILSNSAGGHILLNKGESFTTSDSTTTGNNGQLSGCFSISENQKVCFSKGNLQYQASTNTWRFAANQYDCIGNDNQYISQSYNGWIDLFGWGTSGYSYGAVCYQPWSTSTSWSNYGFSSGSGSLSGMSDWGYNAISNGGNTIDTWRTLSKVEWQYLFLSRNTNSGIRFAKAKVDGVNGVVLLPDDWTTDIYGLNDTNNNGASFNSNVVNSTQWERLEDAGAVFLPAAGGRNDKTMIDFGVCCYYWSSSRYEVLTNHANAYCLGVDDYDINCEYAVYRYYGLSVRLVRPII